MKEKTTIASADGVRLEALWDAPPEAAQALVLCHPHPRHGGTMSVPLMVAVTKALVTRGVAVLRFNFRGVGGSTGTHDHGRGERDDVGAAVAHVAAERPELPIALGGWSFGAAVTLAWQAATRSDHAYVGIAPPLSPGLFSGLPSRDDLAPAPRTFVFGDRDQFTSIADARAYAEAVGARLEVIQGSDHFFYFREDRVADVAARAIGVSSGPPPQ